MFPQTFLNLGGIRNIKMFRFRAGVVQEVYKCINHFTPKFAVHLIEIGFDIFIQRWNWGVHLIVYGQFHQSMANGNVPGKYVAILA